VRILHTADWHLGKTIAFTNFDLAPVHEAVLERLIAIAERESIDIVVVAGDLFDSVNPPARAERLLISTLKRLAEGGGGRPVVVVAGNHDSPERLSALNPLAMESLIFIGGFVKEDFGGVEMGKGRWKVRGSGRFLLFTDTDSGETLAVHLLPYASEYRLGEVFYSHDNSYELEYAGKVKELMGASMPFDAHHRMLVSHLYAGGGKSLTDEEKPLFIGGSSIVPAGHFPHVYDYVALGHLHTAQAVTPSIAYAGSIFPLIPHPLEKEKYVQIVDFGSVVAARKVPLGLEEVIEVRVVASVEQALEPVDEGRVLYLYFKDLEEPLDSSDVRHLKEQHGEYLAAVRVTVKEEGVISGTVPEIASDELSPPEWFRRFYAYKKSEEPPPQVMNLCLKLLGRGEEEA
jgi:DNA repair protein SbcD/Mre11